MTLSITSAMHSTSNSISTVECGGCLKGRTVEKWASAGRNASLILQVVGICIEGAAVGEINSCTNENGRNLGPLLMTAVGLPMVVAALISNLVCTWFLPLQETLTMNKLELALTVIPFCLHIAAGNLPNQSNCLNEMFSPLTLYLTCIVPELAFTIRAVALDLQVKAIKKNEFNETIARQLKLIKELETGV